VPGRQRIYFPASAGIFIRADFDRIATGLRLNLPSRFCINKMRVCDAFLSRPVCNFAQRERRLDTAYQDVFFFHPRIHGGSNFFRPVETVLTRELAIDGEKKGGGEEQVKKQPYGL
jgi:hypothetical protein